MTNAMQLPRGLPTAECKASRLDTALTTYPTVSYVDPSSDALNIRPQRGLMSQ